ncbi:hypothetical protein RSSM_06688 [Rhodopirellula sallentina SM41]|uniref:Uncharacterized protein n=1 Tax=Rhodopirellula sallentina SM41 TaxID=1263870 RepID=M5TS47_9BACT|nr:hypothetical protein RSSM_06688 [Rhodopirellula sallentina SM41]
MDAIESIQFSVENVVINSDSVLNSDHSVTVQFIGFDGVFDADDAYVLVVGNSGLRSRVTTDDADFKFPPTTVLTLSCPKGKFRVRDLTGSFAISLCENISSNRTWEAAEILHGLREK